MVVEGRQGVMVVQLTAANPIAQIQSRLKDLEAGFRSWLAKQPLPVEAAVVTGTGAIQGAAIGGLMGTLTSDMSSSFPSPPPQAAGLSPQAMSSLKQAQAFAGGPLVQARNFAVMTGVNAGISCVMKRIRGVEDVQSSNARHGGGTIIPHLNFSIPCAALEPVFKFSDTQDASILEILDKPNELLSSLWALVPPKSSKQQSELDSKNYREGKGSRFSQFLAEQNAEIASLKELNHFKKMIISSKI